MTGPYSGVRVIDATHVLAGPFCSYQLALLGADVIRVERVDGGDFVRRLGPDEQLNAAGLGPSFLGQNANKRSVTLDLKQIEGRDLFRRLARDADVVVENFRPGRMEALGLGFDALAAHNDRLVYCSITGYGQHGPSSDAPVYDHVMQAVSGMADLNGDPGTPRRVGFPVIDYVTGLLGAQAIGAALFAREREPRPRHLDVSMLEAALTVMNANVQEVLLTGSVHRPPPGVAFSRSPFSGYFETADGLLSVTANNLEQAGRLCTALGCGELMDDPRMARWAEHPELAAEVRARVGPIYRERDAQSWERVLNRHGVPAGKMRGLEELLAHPQVEAVGAVRPAVKVPAIDREVRVPGSGFRIDGEGARIHRPPPVLGEHTDEVLGALGLGAAELADLRARRVIA